MDRDKQSYFETVSGMIAVIMYLHSEILSVKGGFAFPCFVAVTSVLAVRLNGLVTPVALIFAPIIALLFLITSHADFDTALMIIVPSLAFTITAVISVMNKLSRKEIRLGIPLQLSCLGLAYLVNEPVFGLGVAVSAVLVFLSLHFVAVKEGTNLKTP